VRRCAGGRTAPKASNKPELKRNHTLVGTVECPGGPSTAGFSAFTLGATVISGASRIDAAAEEGARGLGLLMRLGQGGLRPHAEHEPCTLAVPVEAPVPGFDSGVGDTELQSGTGRIINPTITYNGAHYNAAAAALANGRTREFLHQQLR
jgi:carboxymethylenebutenolidase